MNAATDEEKAPVQTLVDEASSLVVCSPIHSMKGIIDVQDVKKERQVETRSLCPAEGRPPTSTTPSTSLVSSKLRFSKFTAATMEPEYLERVQKFIAPEECASQQSLKATATTSFRPCDAHRLEDGAEGEVAAPAGLVGHEIGEALLDLLGFLRLDRAQLSSKQATITKLFKVVGVSLASAIIIALFAKDYALTLG